jgi:hypothetical protein
VGGKDHERRDISLIDVDTLNRIQIPITRKFVMTRRVPLVGFIYPGAPSNEGGPRVVRVTIPMTPPITHPMVGSEDPSGGVVPVKVVDELDDVLDALVDDFDVVEVLFRVRAVSMSCCIETEQVEKKDVLVFAEGRV